MVIQEVQRMYPVLPWLDRIPEHDYTFSGTNVTLKKGFPVILPLGAMQRDPKYFSSPEKFDPERFSEINKAKITPFTYFPFGEGPRQCIGILTHSYYINVNKKIVVKVNNVKVDLSITSVK